LKLKLETKEELNFLERFVTDFQNNEDYFLIKSIDKNTLKPLLSIKVKNKWFYIKIDYKVKELTK
jgi:hypothetical protein